MLKPNANSIKDFVSIMDTVARAYHLKIRTYRPSITIQIETERFLVKTAENGHELALALKLRHDVFYRELLDRRLAFGLDVDRFDFISDHLLIFDKKKNELAGTYRMNSSVYSDTFYSETEFHMTDILSLPGTKLELGRACVHKDYRGGVFVALLWKGIGEYIRATGADWLFGCSSVKTTDAFDVSLIMKHLSDSGHLHPEFSVTPRRKFMPKKAGTIIERMHAANIDASPAASLLSPLLSSYFKAGAKVCGLPAIDREFKCADFMTLIDVKNSETAVMRKFAS